MKDPSDWNQQDWDMHQYDQSCQDMTPLEYAESQPDWDEKYGKCTQLLFRVLQEQKGTVDDTAYSFMYMIQDFAVQVIAHKAPCTLDFAYEVAGYDMGYDIKPGFKIKVNGDCSGTVVVSGNTDPVPF